MYCRNCGKQISSIAEECPYCKTKITETNEIHSQQKNQQNNDNNVLYYGMNGKPVTIWKFILGLMLLIGFPILFIIFIS